MLPSLSHCMKTFSVVEQLKSSFGKYFKPVVTVTLPKLSLVGVSVVLSMCVNYDILYIVLQ